MNIPNTIIKTVERTYKPTINPNPIWEVERTVTTRTFTFTTTDIVTGEILGSTRLVWRHDSNDTKRIDVYRGCSYRIFGYNPLPVTDWFHGIPLVQMLKWCKQHGMINMKYVRQDTVVDYVDACTWDECNGVWVVPYSSRNSSFYRSC